MAVKTLNQKGYIAENCSSGHVYESCLNSYIKFYDEVELPSLPRGYKYDGICTPMPIKKRQIV